MKIEKQVVSLELSRQLEKLGVKQKSIWYWVHGARGTYHIVLAEIFDGIEPNRIKFSAFTVAELGEILKMTEKIDLGWGAHTEWNDVWKKWTCFLINGECETETQKEARTEANARAKILCYLIENSLITL